MKDHDRTQPVELLHYFEKDLLGFVQDTLGNRPIVWQDLLEAKAQSFPRIRLLISGCLEQGPETRA